MSGNGRNYPQIDISQKPKDGSIAIYSGGGDITFTVTKGTINVPEGFTKYIHTPNGTQITLNGKLENKSQIGTAGRSISNVTEVLVYHWNGAPTEPILLRIKHDNKNIPEYYGKHNNSWFSSPVQEYKLTDTSGQNRETRISRVTYNGKPTDIDPTKLSALTEPQPGPGGDENTTTLPQDVQAEVKAARLSGHPGPPGKVSDKGELVPPAEKGKDGVGVLSGGKMSHSTRRNGDASFLTFSSIVQEFGNILKTAVTLLKTSTQQSDEGSSPVLGAVGGNGPQGPAGKADGVSGDKGDVTPTRTSTSEAKTSNSISPSLKAQDADDVPSSVGTQYNAADQPNIAATNDNKVEDTQPGDVGSRGPSPGTSLPSSVSNGGESPPTGTTQAPSTTATTSAPADSPPKESEAAEALAAESAGFTVLTGLGSTSGTLAGSTATFFGGWNLYKHYLDTCIQ